eukprot:COSAG01_NODE_6102_length_3849_cov_17.469333_4_plen_61_part_00
MMMHGPLPPPPPPPRFGCPFTPPLKVFGGGGGRRTDTAGRVVRGAWPPRARIALSSWIAS